MYLKRRGTPGKAPKHVRAWSPDEDKMLIFYMRDLVRLKWHARWGGHLEELNAVLRHLGGAILVF